MPAAFQLLRQPVRTVLGAREHQHLVPVAVVDEMREQVALVILRHAIHLLIDADPPWRCARRLRWSRDCAGCWLASSRISSAYVAENMRFWRCARQQLDDAPDRADEAHVEHAIRFVQHEALHAGADRAQRCSARSSRRPGVATSRSQPLRSASICGLMLTPPNTTTVRRLHELAVRARALGNLCGELARGSEHQRARRATGRAGSKLLQNGQHEGGRLAGARLGAARARRDPRARREWPWIEWGSARVALFGHGTQQLGQKPEIGK